MKTKQSVELIHYTPLWVVANAIRYSHSNHDKSDTKTVKVCPACEQNVDIEYIDQEFKCNSCGEVFTKHKEIIVLGPKDFDLIKRVGMKMKHESVLEFGTLVFDVKMSTKALLEAERHRVGISMTVTSSRYALNKIEILFEPTGDPEIDDDLEWWKHQIEMRLKQNKPLDKVSKMLPQAFIYSMQLQFNLRSLLHFLRLRLTKEAHEDIRRIAIMLVKALPDDYQKLVFLDEKIKSNYIKLKNDKQ